MRERHARLWQNQWVRARRWGVEKSSPLGWRFYRQLTRRLSFEVIRRERPMRPLQKGLT